MKKLCFLLAVVLALAGCGKMPEAQPTQSDEITGNPWVSFDIYAINDLHGKLKDTDAQPGVDELSTYLTQVQTGNAILLSTGDMWQGTSESNLTGGLMVTEWMNRMGFTAMTLGGHEFDWGEAQIQKNDQAADFPFLGINVYSLETGKQADYCQSSVIVDIDGVQIGIIGAIGDCASSISSENIQNVSFKTGAELTALVKAESQKLRQQGAEFIVYAIHDGYNQTTSDTNALEVDHQDIKSYYDTTLSDGYVDLVFEADSHYWYVLQDQEGVYHLQAGGNNSGLSHARVLINRKTGETSVVTAELLSSGKYSYMDDHPVVDELLEKYAEQIAPANKILGSNSQYRPGSFLCQLVADLYCKNGLKKWGEQYDIVLAGGYISCRSPGYLNAGDVTYSQLQSLLPFDNQITLCTIQGRDLIAKFLETENQAYYIKTTSYGESIRSSIEPDTVYYVVTDSYSAQYTYNHMTVVDIYDPGIFARDLVADYISAGGLA